MPNTTEYCPHCGEEIRRYRIPSLGGGRARYVNVECECEGARAERKARYVEHKSDVLRAAWERTGVPRRYLDVPTDYEGLGRLEGGRGLYIYGTRGVGKTYSAASILKAYVARNTSDAGWCSARFTTTIRWLDEIQETFGRWNASAEDAFRRAAGSKLLVIDDFGKLNSRASEWGLSRLFRLVDERNSAMLPTIFTSKYSLSALARRFDAVDPETSGDMISRIRETCDRVEMTGEDRRLAG